MRTFVAIAWATLLCAGLPAQSTGPSGLPELPDALYYVFDEGAGATTTANLAVPIPGGGSSAPLTGHTMNNAGMTGTGLTGNGAVSSNLNTGWVMDLGANSWTIHFWLDLTGVTWTNPFFPGIPSMYLFGDFSTNQFNAVVVGTTVRLSAIGIPQMNISGAAATNSPHAIGFTYDATTNNYSCYLDGVFLAAQPGNGTPNLSGNGTNAFAIGGFLVTSTLASGAVIDEFRLWRRALTAAEIQASWDISLGSTLAGSYQVNQPGCTLLVNGASGSPATPTNLSVVQGANVTVQLTSVNQNQLWDLGFGTNPLVSLAGGALTSSDGQVVNLDLSDPALGSWFNVMQNAPPFKDLQAVVTVFPGPPVALQAIVADPTRSSGVSLSQATRITVN